MSSLETYGWTASREAAFHPYRDAGLEPARVIQEQRSVYAVQTGRGELRAGIAGRLRHEAATAEEMPAVGDFVALDCRHEEGAATIHHVLPRRSSLVRKAAGRQTVAQVVATNLDTVFLVTSLNREFNVRRLERYLALIWESGAEPAVLLSKSDLVDSAEALVADAEASAVGVPVLAVSGLTGEGLEEMEPWLGAGRTAALVGSSGVGKSTLINRLAGEELLAVKEIREDDSKGRHTTSHRELVVLPSGGMLIDTPGMRELALWDSPTGVGAAFSDIEELIGTCRFSDCAHRKEPGCALKRAVQNGDLDSDRLENYLKLLREQAWMERKQRATARQEEKLAWQKVVRDARNKPISAE